MTGPDSRTHPRPESVVEPGRQALAGGWVLAPDGESFRRATVHVQDGVITGVDSQPPGPDEELVDAHESYLVPGLIDSHYHLISRSQEHADERMVAQSMLEGVVNAQDCIASGVTTVRDCGTRHTGIYALQDAIASGYVVGPDSVAAGRNPTGSAAPIHWRNVVADGPEGMRAAVRAQVEAGAQWVKVILAHAEDPLDWGAVTVFMSDAEIAAAVDEAHRLGVRVGAHCEGWEVAERGVALGLDSLDHAPLLSQDAVAGMAARGMTYTPTVWAFSTDAGIDPADLPAERAERLEAWREVHRQSVRRAVSAGVPVAAGSDAASTLTGPGVLLNEMLALTGCGLTPAAALRAATITGAAQLGLAGSAGALRPGLRADVVAVTGDPLDDLEVLREPAWVRKAGRVVCESGTGIVHGAHRRLDDAVVARW